MSIEALLKNWPVEPSWVIEPLSAGNNHRTYSITTRNARFILRIAQNAGEDDRFRYEHALLLELADADLPFAVPKPLPTLAGITLLPVSNEGYAALFQAIPGDMPDRDNRLHYQRSGTALAHLDHTLSAIPSPARSAPYPPLNDLARIHPAVPDPLRMIEQLPCASQQRVQIHQHVTALIAVLPHLYSLLPQQVVHRDFDASNVLMVGDIVTGVLDFEFAGPDLRAYDLARSLSMFTISPWNMPEGCECVAAFVLGYREHMSLTSDEIETLPDLMRLYRVWSLIHREGRRRQGVATEEDVQARASGLLRQDEWLTKQRHELLALLR
jgi:homoserine kinase type II